MIISTATKSLCKRCNADMKEKLACELIHELITASGLPFIYLMECRKYVEWAETAFNIRLNNPKKDTKNANAKLACRYFQQHSHNFYVYFYLDHSSQVTLELRWCHNIPKYIWVHDVIPLNYVLFHIVYNIYKHKLVHDTQRAQHAQSKEHSTYIVTSEIMKAILCAHPPHHQNGFVVTCRLWTASGGVIYINMVCIYKYSIYFELKFFGFHVQSWSDW